MRLGAAQEREDKQTVDEQGSAGGQGSGAAAGELGGLGGREAVLARDREGKGSTAGLRAAGKRKQRQQQPQATTAAGQGDLKARYHVIPRWVVHCCGSWCC